MRRLKILVTLQELKISIRLIKHVFGQQVH